MKRNLTIQLDEDVVRKARVIAAQRGKSISRLVTEQIEELVRRDDDYQRVMKEALAELERGYDLGSGGKLPRRDELYDR